MVGGFLHLKNALLKNNWYNTPNIFQVCNLISLPMYSAMKPWDSQYSGHILSPSKVHYFIIPPSCPCPTHHPQVTVYLLRWNPVVFTLLLSASFIQCDHVEIHPCHRVSIIYSFYSWVVFHCPTNCSSIYLLLDICILIFVTALTVQKWKPSKCPSTVN